MNNLLISQGVLAEMEWEKNHPQPSPELAIDAAHLAIDEYYNGDRAWGEQWLLKAYAANQKDEAK